MKPRQPKLPRAVEMGPTVHLRYPSRSDRDEFLGLKRASRAFLKRWEASPTGLNTFSAAWFERFISKVRGPVNHRFLICLNSWPHEIVGQIGLSNIVLGAFQSCYVGYWIGAAHARKGYTTEALGLALRFALNTLKLHRVEANIIPSNRASKAVVAKHGFRYEGTAARYLKIAGRWQDHEHWAITAEEYPARPLKASRGPRPARASSARRSPH